ncbi:hypothetical protein Rhopal_003736-T1 [Rhodotorula paludigena]|uniref:Proteophosphoglycan ppg4 n=1 Tax=Rhodotorula paludigena TaxID=86838 RepID=A0AAV5GMK8_9BASI|nr:hypothetical protein Rhopal_003736-T1 [Rhodotorula paludigena]
MAAAPPFAVTDSPAAPHSSSAIVEPTHIVSTDDEGVGEQFADAEENVLGANDVEKDAPAEAPRPKLSTHSSQQSLSSALAASSLADTPTARAGPLPPARRPSETVALVEAPDDNEIEALTEGASVQPRERKSSLTPSEENLLFPSAKPAEDPRRASVDGSASMRSLRSKSSKSGSAAPRPHAFATAKSYFPLVSDPKKRKADAATSPSVSSTPNDAPLSPAVPAIGPRSELPREQSSSSLASSTAPSRQPVFPTIAPSRSAGSSAFPLVKSPGATTTPPASDAASTWSGSASAASPAPARTPSSAPTRATSPPASSYAPSIAQTNRSGGTAATKRRTSQPFVPSYVASQAPSYAESFYATSAEPIGPTSIFANPTPQQRPLSDLLPKKKLLGLFGGSKKKSAAPTQGTAAAGRGKSALILDAALTTSQTWAAHRGEQSRMPAFGPPAGYRPAHQVRRQQEEAAAAAAAAGAAVAQMGGGGEDPVSQAAIAEAFARNSAHQQGGGVGAAGVARRDSVMSMGSVADIASPASGSGGAFPIRRDVFATKPRPKPSAAGGAAEGAAGPQAVQTGLGIA